MHMVSLGLIRYVHCVTGIKSSLLVDFSFLFTSRAFYNIFLYNMNIEVEIHSMIQVYE